jgi:hypothetical protein
MEDVFDAVAALPVNAAVIVPAEKLPDPSLATIVEAVLAEVALEVTVKVVAPAWFAVNEADPDRPVPDVASVSVPLPTDGISEVSAIVPVVAGMVIVVVPAAALGFKTVEPDVDPGIVTLRMPVIA